MQNCWTAKHCSLEVDAEDHIVAVRGASELGYGFLLTAIQKLLQNKWQVFILDHQDSKPRPAASSPQTYWKDILGSIMLRFKWKEFNIEYFFLASNACCPPPSVLSVSCTDTAWRLHGLVATFSRPLSFCYWAASLVAARHLLVVWGNCAHTQLRLPRSTLLKVKVLSLDCCLICTRRPFGLILDGGNSLSSTLQPLHLMAWLSCDSSPTEMMILLLVFKRKSTDFGFMLCFFVCVL